MTSVGTETATKDMETAVVPKQEGEIYSKIYRIDNKPYTLAYGLVNEVVRISIEEVATKTIFFRDLPKESIKNLTDKVGFSLDPKQFFDILRMGLKGDDNIKVKIEFKCYNEASLEISVSQKIMDTEILKVFTVELYPFTDCKDIPRIENVLRNVHKQMEQETYRVDIIRDVSDQRLDELERMVKQIISNQDRLLQSHKSVVSDRIEIDEKSSKQVAENKADNKGELVVGKIITIDETKTFLANEPYIFEINKKHLNSKLHITMRLNLDGERGFRDGENFQKTKLSEFAAVGLSGYLAISGKYTSQTTWAGILSYGKLEASALFHEHTETGIQQVRFHHYTQEGASWYTLAAGSTIRVEEII